MSKPVIVRDTAGNILSYRRPDGTGWDSTYDKNGNELSFRHTDGTGYDFTYDKNGNTLTRTEVFPEVKP